MWSKFILEVFSGCLLHSRLWFRISMSDSRTDETEPSVPPQRTHNLVENTKDFKTRKVGVISLSSYFTEDSDGVYYRQGIVSSSHTLLPNETARKWRCVLGQLPEGIMVGRFGNSRGTQITLTNNQLMTNSFFFSHVECQFILKFYPNLKIH